METNITSEEAQKIAEQEASCRRQLPRLAGYEFGPVVFDSENDASWLFVCASNQMQDEGWIPGAIYVRVDKQDGHIWSEQETEAFFATLAAQSQHEMQPAWVA